ncbi:hypothetical protein Poly24_29790 [Rosistilla carotiformis]|uniref:Uncharacterized protein n=1 Tax=Rosistilla carotiformis TaxID=2528017 RepID=A0A518JUP1_9BACT|nr:hypothetical protein Poly24_29790 [Rosistilla carotiformis]
MKRVFTSSLRFSPGSPSPARNKSFLAEPFMLCCSLALKLAADSLCANRTFALPNPPTAFQSIVGYRHHRCDRMEAADGSLAFAIKQFQTTGTGEIEE